MTGLERRNEVIGTRSRHEADMKLMQAWRKMITENGGGPVIKRICSKKEIQYLVARYRE